MINGRLDMKARIALAVASLFFFTEAPAQQLPKLPYADWGSCTFECCTYGDWRATKSIVAHQQADSHSPVVFKVKSGQSVRAITGVVITTQYGVTKILKSMKIGYVPKGQSPELSLNAGDLVYTLHYQGEASDLFWYEGKTYSDQIDVPDDAFGNPPNASTLKVLSRPKYEWWVKLRNSDGKIGWTKETQNFSGVDACN